MIIDLNEITTSPEFSCDLCIIGTGAAGLSLVSNLFNTTYKIILVESGGLCAEAETQSLY